MAIRNSSLVLLSGWFMLLVVVASASGQSFRAVSKTAEFTEYEYRNDNLAIGSPKYLMAPWRDGSARYRVMAQEIVPVTADSSQMHYAKNAEFFLIADRRSPVIEIGEPGHTRGAYLAQLTVNVSRLADRDAGAFQVLRHMRIRIYHEQEESRARRSVHETAQVQSSPLSSGEWFKIPIPEDDLYVLDADYLDALGVDIASIDPNRIQIWSTNGYIIPSANNEPRSELTQVRRIVEAESGNSFGENDRVIFYANGPNRHFLDQTANRFQHELHPYAATNYVFLTVGDEPGKQMVLRTAEEIGSPTREVRQFRDFRWLEEDLEKSESRIKSGRYWFGQRLEPARTSTIFTDTLAGFVDGSDLEVELSMAARALSTSGFQVIVNNTSLPRITLPGISSFTSATGESARVTERRNTLSSVTINNDILQIRATYESNQSDARGWVNWIRIRADRHLQAHDGKLRFHPPDDSDGSPVRYRISGFDSTPIILDVTDPVSNPVMIEPLTDGNEYTAVYYSDRHRQFFAASRFKTPPAGEALSNQNLRDPGVFPDYVIVTAPIFLQQAQRLADYRQSRDGLTPVIVTQEQIFNEFNGGVPDVTAIRDYLKHLYDRGAESGQQRPEYLLLLGDATYDFKGVIRNPALQNHVFTFQSEESINRTYSYASDDYFGFLSDDGGTWRGRELVDLGIGRLPVQTPDQADLLIDKIKVYEDPRNRGDWNNLFTFIADDDIASRGNERDLHILNADGTADVIDRDLTGIRLDKIYQISYPSENTSAGVRVPQATQAMIDRINNGTLVFNFSGHGSEQFLTDQRLFTSDDISRLNNRNRLSIMVTATCSFGRYDNTEEHSGAEKMLLHPDGGLVAALTTSRVVFTSPSPTHSNFGLNRVLTEEMTRRDENGRPQRLGDIFRNTKITHIGSSDNSRRFILLGDPAMRIGLPEFRAEVTHINGEAVPQGDSLNHENDLDDAQIQAGNSFAGNGDPVGEMDTVNGGPSPLIELRALDQVNISGHVSRADGSVNTSFNGEANVRVYDAERLVRFPDRDWVAEGNCYLDDCGYLVQTDALFSGRVSVSDGVFSSRFIIPKDVSYSQNPGRIHVFARERDHDAVGATSVFRISGRNPDADELDNRRGPDIDIFLNDEMFVDGGIVNDAPQLIILLSDDAGINTTGAGVGHEIVAIIENRDDPSNRRTISLNEFYQSELDDFTSGRIEYPLSGLEEGSYRLRVRAWDVFNNMGESDVTFQVLDSKDLQIRNVFNYPNPMHNFTHFIFEHNQPGIPMDISIRIYTLSGKPVATIRREQMITAGNMVRLDWHGRDDDQHRLATGTYLYHVQVRADTANGRQTKDKIERLVILR
ncbi:type IX secretion system sortase PorU [Balneolales bacterium ANBcel1]|nr:type IX secretion system sortase PorU [Balneolales bacterium ANBcel1]